VQVFQLELYARSPSSWRKRLESDARVLAQYRRLFGDTPLEGTRRNSKKKQKRSQQLASPVEPAARAAARPAGKMPNVPKQRRLTMEQDEPAGHGTAALGAHAMGKDARHEGTLATERKGSARSVADDVMAVLGIHSTLVAGDALQTKKKRKKEEKKKHIHRKDRVDAVTSLASMHAKKKSSKGKALQGHHSSLPAVEGGEAEQCMLGTKRKKMRTLNGEHDQVQRLKAQ
jgi:hypothetical protein